MGFPYDKLDPKTKQKALIDAALARERSRNHCSTQTTNLESYPRYEPQTTNEFKAFDSSVHIHVHSVWKRKTDPDGVSAKWAIDGLIEAGIIRDDGPQYVSSVTFTQEKGKPEKTVITIVEDRSCGKTRACKLVVDKVKNGGFMATLSVPYNGKACVFTEKYVATGYERRHAVDRARLIAEILGWKIEE